jgi:hypothetical protein
MNADIAPARERLRHARDRAKHWLLRHVTPDGRPVVHDIGNGWSRFPWTLALLGEIEAAHGVLDWAAREGLGANGDLAAGAAYGKGRFSAYPLGHLTMGALLLERSDIAKRLFDRLAELQLPNGGMPIDPPGGDLETWGDLLSTAQAGIAALLGGRIRMARRIHDWIRACLVEQPRMPDILYAARGPHGLIANPPEALRWVLAVEFGKPRQAYFYPGIAAVFLALYAMRTGSRPALQAGHDYLAFNLLGTDAQIDDLASVQACKFGWGLALMHIADPMADYADALVRMADWLSPVSATTVAVAPPPSSHRPRRRSN